MRWWRNLRPTTTLRYLRECRGAATVEFVVVFVPLVVMVMVIVDLGLFMGRSVMLNRGADIALREIRLGSLPPGTRVTEDGTVLVGEPLKRLICQNGFLLSDCFQSIQVEMRPLDDVTNFGSGTVDCVDRDQPINPVNTYDQGAPSEIMFVRVCYVVDPIFPGTGFLAHLPASEGGGYAIVYETAFVNEPS